MESPIPAPTHAALTKSQEKEKKREKSLSENPTLFILIYLQKIQVRKCGSKTIDYP